MVPKPFSSRRKHKSSAFTSLPQELQDKIWQHTFDRRIVELRTKTCMKPGEIPGYRLGEAYIWSPTYLPVALSVCQSSRREALRHYEPCFPPPNEHPRVRSGRVYINFAMDHVLINQRLGAWSKIEDNVDTSSPHSDWNKIQHLVAVEPDYDIWMFLDPPTSLKTIGLVTEKIPLSSWDNWKGLYLAELPKRSAGCPHRAVTTYGASRRVGKTIPGSRLRFKMPKFECLEIRTRRPIKYYKDGKPVISRTWRFINFLLKKLGCPEMSDPDVENPYDQTRQMQALITTSVTCDKIAERLFRRTPEHARYAIERIAIDLVRTMLRQSEEERVNWFWAGT